MGKKTYKTEKGTPVILTDEEAAVYSKNISKITLDESAEVVKEDKKIKVVSNEK